MKHIVWAPIDRSLGFRFILAQAASSSLCLTVRIITAKSQLSLILSHHAWACPHPRPQKQKTMKPNLIIPNLLFWTECIATNNKHPKYSKSKSFKIFSLYMILKYLLEGSEKDGTKDRHRIKHGSNNQQIIQKDKQVSNEDDVWCTRKGGGGRTPFSCDGSLYSYFLYFRIIFRSFDHLLILVDYFKICRHFKQTFYYYHLKTYIFLDIVLFWNT